MGVSGLAGFMRPKAMRGMKLKETMNAATRVVVITIGKAVQEPARCPR